MSEHLQSRQRSTFGQRSRPSTAVWEKQYQAAVVGSDLLAVALSLTCTALLLGRRVESDGHGRLALAVGGTAVVLCACLLVGRAWRAGVLGQGAEEFRRLGSALLSAAVVLALIALAVGAPHARPWVFVVMPIMAVLAMPQRYLLRRYLHRARRHGRCLLPVLAAGAQHTVADLIGRTRRTPHLGWRVAAICTEHGKAADGTGEINGVPVIGTLDELAEHVRRGGYRIVGVTADAYWTPVRLQRLAWHLEGSTAELVVAPVLMEVAGPRVHVSGVLGMPLLRVSSPAFTGVRRAIKEVFDRTVAAVLCVGLLPVGLVIAALVRLGGPGPVLYRQRRLGKDGRQFTLLRFRTRAVRVDLALGAVRRTAGAGPAYTLRGDPRVTGIGRWLRRHSLDRMPQLLNVLTGSMSLVGPRPPRPEELAGGGPEARRRLLVKPGLTGLWQVSGHEDAAGTDPDLRYVADWSLALDALILWKALRGLFT